MISRIRDFWDNVRRIFFLIVMLLGIAVLTIVLLNPDTIRDFVNSISAVLRVLFLVAVYGGFGFYAYRILSGQSAEKGIDGLISRVGGKVTGISPDIAQAQIHKALHEIGGIKSLDVDVNERRGRAVIKISITFNQDNLNVVQKQNEVRRKLDHVVKKQLGIMYAEDPIIALNSQGGAPTSKSVPEQKPVTSPTPTPVTDEDDDNNPEWQAILKASQPPADDKKEN
jgi:hypothetical protein